ncbi:MAG: P-II family nitrogen regulator [Opitutaceae bacterium]|nr:P-II family nitrogen regulator [Opitutaceae bacterium]
MKVVIGYIRPSKEDDVLTALHEIAGLSGGSFSDVRGFGRGRKGQSDEGRREIVTGTLPRVRVEVMVPDALAATVQSAIATAAHTGNRGDGKVFILPLESALRISNHESGEKAV